MKNEANWTIVDSLDTWGFKIHPLLKKVFSSKLTSSSKLVQVLLSHF